MKLKNVKIKNFRSIKEDEFSFDNYKCKVLVGINEAGKTNILKALSLLDLSKQFEASDKRTTKKEKIDEYFTRFIFELENDDIEYILNEILYKENYFLSDEKLGNNSKIFDCNKKSKSLVDFVNYTPFLLKKVLYINSIKDSRLNNYFSNYAINDGLEKYNFKNNWKKVSDICPSDFSIMYNNENIKIKDYQYIDTNFIKKCLLDNNLDFNPEYFVDCSNEDIENFINVIRSSSKEFVKKKLPEVIYWKYKEENLLPNKVNIEDFKNNPSKYEPLKNMFELAGYNNIKQDIQQAQSDGDVEFENMLEFVQNEITNHFKKVWKEKEIGNIKFILQKDGLDIKIRIKEKSNFNPDQRSDGFKRFVTFLLFISTRVKSESLSNIVLLVDEPENSLHPKGAKFLMDELIEISKHDNYVVYSTHSIYMIDRKNIDRHYIVKKSDEETSLIYPSDSAIAEEEVLYNAMGHSCFEVMKDNNIIFEGYRDKKMFEKALTKRGWSKETKKLKNIGLTFVRGVKEAKSLVKMMEMANKKWFIISDSDKAAQDKKRDYETDYREEEYGKAWFMYNELEGTENNSQTQEDYISEELIKKAFKSVIKNYFEIKDSEPDYSRVPILEEIDKWIKDNFETNKDKRKTIINEIKTFITENLEIKHIKISYLKILKHLSKNISNN